MFFILLNSLVYAEYCCYTNDSINIYHLEENIGCIYIIEMKTTYVPYNGSLRLKRLINLKTNNKVKLYKNDNQDGYCKNFLKTIKCIKV